MGVLLLDYHLYRGRTGNDAPHTLLKRSYMAGFSSSMAGFWGLRLRHQVLRLPEMCFWFAGGGQGEGGLHVSVVASSLWKETGCYSRLTWHW